MELEGYKTIQQSVVKSGQTTYGMVAEQQTNTKKLVVQGDQAGFVGEQAGGELMCDLTPENAMALRSRLPWLNPAPLGTQTSFGFGDRLGTATPGHIAALRVTELQNEIAPVLAQQSVRENDRTGRTPQQVVDDAMWGALETGWRRPWGADADHVKEISHLAPFVGAGYTFFTLDPSDHVDNDAQTDSLDTLRSKAADLPWEALQTTLEAVSERYRDPKPLLNEITLQFSEETLLRALVKYGRAIAHTKDISQHLTAQMAGRPFDLEMSVDETDTPTSVYEHFFIASELNRLNVDFVSLAPRFVGKFQKGVDYLGDLDAFEADFEKHVAVMKHFGSYKLSIHTGSDKFSLYPITARLSQGWVHVKTAGTSYLEALRVIAQSNQDLFRRILAVARARFEHDRKTYFLDAKLSKMPGGESVNDENLPVFLEQFDSRQVLHVTFGSILDDFNPEFAEFISAHESEYERVLERHFSRHLAPFSRTETAEGLKS
jgi:hypothetical protein